MPVLPTELAAAGVRAARMLDVRSTLQRGADPFCEIMEAVGGLADDEALHLVASFTPAPLIEVMTSMGRRAHVQADEGAVHVWFFRDASSPPAPRAPEGAAPLLAPARLDVRELEPPLPMQRILERLAELGPGAQLLVRHHRDPAMLHAQLARRGFSARVERRGEDDYLVHVAPAWVFARGDG